MKKEIVITGIGIVSGMGLGKEEFWTAAQSAEHAIIIKEEWEEYDMPAQYFGECKKFNIRDHFKLRPPFPNYYSQLGLMATKYAIEDSKLDMESIDPYDIGCIVNTYYGSNQSVEKYLTRLFDRGPKRVSPLGFTQTTVNHIVGDIARNFQLRGPSTITMGEESINLAIQSIQNDQAKVMICGGLDHVREFHIKALYDNKELKQPKKNNINGLFDGLSGEKTDDGNLLGEASCFLVIEEKSHALARGAHIYAEISGTRSGFDSISSLDYYERDNHFKTRLMNRTMDDIGIAKTDLDLFVGASTSSELIEKVDIDALESIGYEGAYTTMLPRLGDCRAANTPMSIAVAAMAIDDSVVPGCGIENDITRNSKINVTKDVKKDYNIDYAMVLSTQLGGSTACYVLKK